MKRLVRMIVAVAMVVAPIAGVTSVALSQPAAAAKGHRSNRRHRKLDRPGGLLHRPDDPGAPGVGEDRQRQGGLEGHPVNLIVKDDGYNPTTSLSQVEGMVTSDHIVALVDNSDVDTSWYTYIEQNKVPVIGGQTEDGPYENADFSTRARRSTTSPSVRPTWPSWCTPRPRPTCTAPRSHSAHKPSAR